jgi:hypothetical protein
MTHDHGLMWHETSLGLLYDGLDVGMHQHLAVAFLVRYYRLPVFLYSPLLV